MLVVALCVPTHDGELAADRLWAAGARAVEELDLGDGRVELRTSLGPDPVVARERLGHLPDGWEFRALDVDDIRSEAWRDHVRPVRITDRLVLVPAWLPFPSDEDAMVVRIEPAGSFGLGDHPTTRLSAAATERSVRVGDQVLDVGSGSGVLGIVAALRGAVRVVATDISEDARVATLDNAARNGVADRISVSTAPLDSLTEDFDLVLANILAPTLIHLAPELRRLTRPTGALVVSGVLTDGYDHVVRALAPMRVADVEHLDGWSAVVLRHPAGA